MRVGVFGAGGRMGRRVCQAVAEADDLDLVAAVDPALAGIDLRQVAGVVAPGLHVGADAAELERAGAEVAVDFTVADAAVGNLQWCADHGVHAVAGTTGMDSAQVDGLRERFEVSTANCLIAANFAIGAVLMTRFSELAAPFMDGVEIIELHHDAKRDAPSGTAMDSARRVADARREAGLSWPEDATEATVVAGARGGVVSGVHVHAVRLPGLVAHQQVIFGAVGQSLTITHDAFDRSSFMPGVLLAIRSIAGREGLTLGLHPLLGF
ncbi:MAG: 4-hydroxy-tetrahydrodipicolinate reductase [Actinomycetota bacterium]|jgi:4-hydroxy-tetrahydrodipicolinate reductase|nr:4-hydroxy-tetrahydrodipicolinate reductase [Actinomycetota bacterium]